MTSAPEVSIVVVTFRDRENLLRCLNAIERHAELPHEVIVVDDASGDGSVEAIRERFPAVHVLAKTSNQGLVAGRNDALPLTSGRFVLMLDSDTELRPRAVPRMVAALDGDSSIGLVGPRMVGPDGELQLSCMRFPPAMIPLLRRGPYARLVKNPRSHRWHMMMDFDHASQRPVAWVVGAAQMWRRELIGRLGGYDPRVSSYGGEDLDWCLRVWEAGLQVQYVPEAEIMHRWQKVTRQQPFGRASRRALRDWYYLQWKHRRLRRSPEIAAANA